MRCSPRARLSQRTKRTWPNNGVDRPILQQLKQRRERLPLVAVDLLVAIADLLARAFIVRLVHRKLDGPDGSAACGPRAGGRKQHRQPDRLGCTQVIASI